MRATASSLSTPVRDAVAVPATPQGDVRRAVRCLARLEAARNLKGLPLWIGLLCCALASQMGDAGDWESGIYTLFPTWFVPLVIGIFVTGVRSGGRDRHVSEPPLADEAVLGPSQRAPARLLGMLPLVGIGAVLVTTTAIALRIEGGHWMGDEPGRTDVAVHTLPEVLQPVLLLVLAAATGVAVGRSVRRAAPVLVLGVALWFLFGMGTWAWQWTPARYVTPVQTQPIEQTIGSAETDPAMFPDHWLLSAPGQYDQDWDRVIVHQAMSAWHDVYLAGLVLAGIGVAVRGRGGRHAVLAGALAVLIGVGAQMAVAPPSSAEPAVSSQEGA